MSSSTRDRILEAAARLVAERGATSLTMADVARESGVSRQFVYLQFENRAGLFSAVTHFLDGRAGIRERFAELLEAEPVAGLEGLMRAWIDYLPDILPVARELNAAAMVRSDGGEAWNVRMEELRRLFRAAAQRVELRRPWTPDTAGDWILVRTHVTAYDELVVRRGWSHADFADGTVRSTLGELLTGR